MEDFGGFESFIATRFGMLLTAKIVIALGLLTIFATSPFVFMQSRWRSAVGHFKHFPIDTGGPEDFRIDRFEPMHYLALGFGLGIVALAKLMYML